LNEVDGPVYPSVGTSEGTMEATFSASGAASLDEPDASDLLETICTVYLQATLGVEELNF